MKRRSRVLGVAVAAVFALSAVVASAAQAYTWTEAGSEIMETEVLFISDGVTLTGTVLGTELEVTADIECDFCHVTSETNGGGGSNRARGTGSLRLSSAHVAKPVGCTILGGSIETTALESSLVSAPGLPSGLAEVFTPTYSGTFATVKIRNCAAAGNYTLTGDLAGEVEEAGVELETQPLRFSETISGFAGASLTLGSNFAYLTGTSTNYLWSGEKWGADAE